MQSLDALGCSNAIVATLCFFIMDRRICAGSRHLPALFFALKKMPWLKPHFSSDSLPIKKLTSKVVWVLHVWQLMDTMAKRGCEGTWSLVVTKPNPNFTLSKSYPAYNFICLPYINNR